MPARSVVLEIGHGPGSSRPDGARFGSLVEREIAEDYVGACIEVLAANHVAVTLRRSGPYEERQTGWQVDGADLYVSCHVNAGLTPPTAKPYALALYLRHEHAVVAADVMMGYRDHLGGDKGPRVVMGIVDGSGAWGTRGAACIRHVPEHVPAIVFEPGFIDHEAHAALWTSIGRERVGAGLARGILRALGV